MPQSSFPVLALVLRSSPGCRRGGRCGALGWPQAAIVGAAGSILQWERDDSGLLAYVAMLGLAGEPVLVRSRPDRRLVVAPRCHRICDGTVSKISTPAAPSSDLSTCSVWPGERSGSGALGHRLFLDCGGAWAAHDCAHRRALIPRDISETKQSTGGEAESPLFWPGDRRTP
jgi:hypothetical protein